MKTLLLTSISLLFVSAMAIAEQTIEFKDETDPITKRKAIELKIGQLPDNSIIFYCVSDAIDPITDKKEKGYWIFAIEPGSTLATYNSAKFQLRFDRTPAITFNGYGNKFGAQIDIEPKVRELLDSAISSKTVYARVDNADIIQVDLLAARAELLKFQKRCGEIE